MVLNRRLKYALLTLSLLLVCSPLLFAHAILVDSSPKANASVNGPEVEFTLRYNVRIDGGRSRVQLIASDGNETTLPLDKQPAADVLKCKATGLKAGSYKLKWNVLASDGHMSSGEVPFTVK